MNDYFHIGEIVAVFGLQGEMILLHQMKNREALKNVDAIFIEDKKGSFIPYFIENIRNKDNQELYLTLEGISSREMARTLLKKKIHLEESHFRQQVDENSSLYYLGFTIEDKEAGTLGKIAEIISMPDQLLAKIYHASSELLIPLNENTLRKVDRKNQIIYIELPEGLLDIYLT